MRNSKCFPKFENIYFFRHKVCSSTFYFLVLATLFAFGSAAATGGEMEAVDIPLDPISYLTADQQAGLARHNHYRQKHKSTPNQTNMDILCTDAANYAKKLVQIGKLEHDSDELNQKQQGENLYKKWSSKPISDPGYAHAVDKWYAEIDMYDWNNPGSVPGTGHFTQVVWKDSTSSCMAHAFSDDKKEVYIVARYKPRGNYKGKYGENVLPLK